MVKTSKNKIKLYHYSGIFVPYFLHIYTEKWFYQPRKNFIQAILAWNNFQWFKDSKSFSLFKKLDFNLKLERRLLSLIHFISVLDVSLSKEFPCFIESHLCVHILVQINHCMDLLREAKLVLFYIHES